MTGDAVLLRGDRNGCQVPLAEFPRLWHSTQTVEPPFDLIVTQRARLVITSSIAGPPKDKDRTLLQRAPPL